MRISDWSSDVCSSDLGLDNKSASPSCLVQASVSLGDGGEACRPIGMFDDLAAAPVQRGPCLLCVPLDQRQHCLFSGVIGLPNAFRQPAGLHAVGLQLRTCIDGLTQPTFLHTADANNVS